MATARAKTNKRKQITNKQLMALLILTVTLVLLALILTSGQAWLTVLGVTITLTVLILSITGTPELLPGTLRAILSEIRRLVRS
ncbi:MAG: hypothetical protein KJ077_32860 [Anaerolineae bacterium]|nr:hypothetical protein [Anaerolineae bacterium]